ncbi:hypothetical protein FIV42_16830 [Persicimonas caeni]|uniref:Porin n=1 Tax=Persicimonas caeni TaxID=2292766 RepID=A0A4Y6PVS7_PERCE|nr:hypothetical protein [Persicimonas caeni]QDG52343.1 hypothetical protein FIV42_16830 [Persicimonas caeni]QED33565.1 hypothetical protein FRD00_16825 [Persicimonas caeni]
MKLLLSCICLLATLTSALCAASETRGTSETREATRLVTFGQLFSTYDYSTTDSAEFNAFRLDRAQLDVLYDFQHLAGFHVALEGIRSAGPDSLFGVDQNSIVARFKFGYGFATPEVGPGFATLRAGLIPDIWIESVEFGYDLRGLAPLAAESSLFFDTSDLGASAHYTAFDGLLRVGASMTNGEGRNQVELNEGKNATFTVGLRPLDVRFWEGEGVLGIHAGYRDGSTGAGQLRNHRAMGAVTFRHPRLGAGVEYERALGYLDRGSREAQVLGGWAHVAVLPPWLAAFGRYDHLDTDLDANDATIDTLRAGLFGDLLPPLDFVEARRLRLYVGYRLDSFGEGAGPVPGVPDAADIHTVFATVEARGIIATSSTDTTP